MTGLLIRIMRLLLMAMMMLRSWMGRIVPEVHVPVPVDRAEADAPHPLPGRHM